MEEIKVYDEDGNQVTMLVQWDLDIYIYIKNDKITTNHNVHFFNSESDVAYVVPSTYEDGILCCKIPNRLLFVALPITGYIYITEDNDSYRSTFVFNILVRSRVIPSDFMYIPDAMDDYISAVKVLAWCEDYAKSACQCASDAEDWANLSKSWAIGDTGVRDGEDTDNSKYYCQEASDSATLAESWAVGGTGSRKGEDTDNSKYYAQQASTSAGNASTSEKNAASSADSAAESAEKAATVDPDLYALREYYANDSMNVGRKSDSTSGSKSFVLGRDCIASSSYSHAEGNTTEASGGSAHAECYYTKATGTYSHSEGQSTEASGSGAHSEGSNTVASGSAAHAEGYGSSDGSTGAFGNYSHAEGYKTSALSSYSHAEGSNTIAGTEDGDGQYSHAEGRSTNAAGAHSHAEGRSTTASGEDSHVEGRSTTASGEDSHAEGYYSQATGDYSHAEGGRILQTGSTSSYYNLQATGDYSHAEGAGSQATGKYSHAEGHHCIGSGESSHAEGLNTTASGTYSHAGGYTCEAQGMASFSSGYTCTASGRYSFATGISTTASGSAASAFGQQTQATASNQTVVGQYNKTSSSAYFIVGNGDSGSRNNANAFRVDYTGDAYAYKINASGADYAEFIKEWADGNTNGEDRVGYFVTIRDGLLYKANDVDYIIGITSGNPSVVGNADEDYYWKYERDDFGRIIYRDSEEECNSDDEIDNHDADMDIDADEVNDSEGVESEEPAPINTHMVAVLSENYDSSLQDTYVERKDRPEWDYVGMIGVIPVRDDGTCKVDEYCKCGGDGIATYAAERGFDTFYVIERVSENVVSVVVK